MLRNIIFLVLAHMVGAAQHHGMGWGGVGDDNVPCTCAHGRCYVRSTFLYLHTWSVLRKHHRSCTCTLARCYATSLESPVPFKYSFCKSNKDILLVNLMCANFEFRHTLQRQMFGFSIGIEVQVESLKHETCDASTFVFDFLWKLVADSKEGLWHVTIFFLTIIIFIITIIYVASECFECFVFSASRLRYAQSSAPADFESAVATFTPYMSTEMLAF